MVCVFAKSGLEFFKKGLQFVLLSLDSLGAQITDAVVQFRQRHVWRGYYNVLPAVYTGFRVGNLRLPPPGRV
jgi:hypothetical protein